MGLEMEVEEISTEPPPFGALATAQSVSITLLVKVQSSSGGRSCVRSGDFDVEPLTREAAFSKGVLRRGHSAPPLHPGMVSLQEEQTTLETGGMDKRSQPSSSADERGRLVAARDEPRPIQSCENETDPRGPRRVPAPPQIIITQGSHAIVAIDLSTQIHGELHTSQLGTFSGGICR